MKDIGSHSKRLTCLCWLSSLVFLCGLMIIISSIYVDQGAGWSFGDDITPPEFKLTKNIGLTFLWLAAIVCFAVGILGCIVIKCDNICLIRLYGSGLGTVSLVVFIIGCVFAFQSSYMPTAVGTLCKEKNTAQPQPFMKRSYLDTNMLYQVNRWMCTSQCPCDANSYTSGYGNTEETYLNYHGRTSVPGTQGKLPITTVPANGLQSWGQCWNNTIRARADENITQSMDSYMKVMRLLEPQYGCSGACIPALFWFTKTIDTQPKDGCLLQVATDLSSTYVFPGWATILSSIIMLLIFLFQYTLWCDEKKGEEE